MKLHLVYVFIYQVIPTSGHCGICMSHMPDNWSYQTPILTQTHNTNPFKLQQRPAIMSNETSSATITYMFGLVVSKTTQEIAWYYDNSIDAMQLSGGLH